MIAFQAVPSARLALRPPRIPFARFLNLLRVSVVDPGLAVDRSDRAKPEPLTRSLEHNSRKHDGEPHSLRRRDYGSAGAAAARVASVMRIRRPCGTPGRIPPARCDVGPVDASDHRLIVASIASRPRRAPSDVVRPR